MKNKYDFMEHFHRERAILMSGEVSQVNDFVFSRFGVRLFHCDSFKACVAYPIDWTHNRLRELGYFDAIQKDEPEYPITINENSFRVARSKIFRSNLRAQPIDLIAWLVSGSPYNLAESPANRQ